jgi:hypothetical protein
VFAIADVFWVSRLGRDAIAVVSITESIMTIIYVLAIGLAMAAGAIVARRIGEKETAAAARAAVQVIALAAIISVAIGAVLAWFAQDILRLMGASDEVVAIGGNFTHHARRKRHGFPHLQCDFSLRRTPSSPCARCGSPTRSTSPLVPVKGSWKQVKV